jgi:predicted lipoprotein with Yx(FWY)xxD motif
VKKTSYRLAALIATGLLIAACGSSSSSRSVPAASAGGTTSASSAYGGGSKSPSASSTTVAAKKNKLGTILAAGPKKLTVYMFEADKGTTSSCSAACAKVWPPVTGTATATPPAQQSLIGTTTRSDGTKQVTYKGHPLYFFAKDKDDGDAYGQGVKHFGGSWYVLKPNGSKIDES